MKKFELIDKSFPKIMHGGDYNPEQWMDTKKIWDEDMRLMKKAQLQRDDGRHFLVGGD